MLLNYSSIQHPTGLEDILRPWGVNVGADVVQEPNNTVNTQDVLVYNFSQHPVVDPLTGLGLELILPRPSAASSGKIHPPTRPKWMSWRFPARIPCS